MAAAAHATEWHTSGGVSVHVANGADRMGVGFLEVRGVNIVESRDWSSKYPAAAVADELELPELNS